jgi:hypothetical protein
MLIRVSGSAFNANFISEKTFVFKKNKAKGLMAAHKEGGIVARTRYLEFAHVIIQEGIGKQIIITY